MTTELFKPKGDEAQWVSLYRLFQNAPVDRLFTYEEMQQATGFDIRGDYRGLVYQAQRRLEQDNRRTLANVPGVGYRIARPEEHEGLAKAHHRRHRRQLQKAARRLASARREELDAETRARFDRLESEVGRQLDMTRRLTARVERVETAVKSKAETSDVAAVQARVSKLEEMLARFQSDG